MRTLILLAAATAALAACDRQDGPVVVQALDPWCRPAPAGALSAGCYVTLTASANDRLVSASTPAARRTEIHSMSMDGGIMRMSALPEGLKLPRNQAVALRPGGEHLMLVGPQGAFAEGRSVVLTLTFEKAPPLVVEASVRQAPVAGAHPGGH